MKVKITKTWTREYLDAWGGFYWNRKDSKLYINGFPIPIFWFLFGWSWYWFLLAFVGINFDWNCKYCHESTKYMCEMC